MLGAGAVKKGLGGRGRNTDRISKKGGRFEKNNKRVSRYKGTCRAG